MRDKLCDCLAFAPKGKYHNYEPLKALINEIIKDVQVAKLMQFPLSKKRKFPLIDRFKYYKFHKEYSHATNDYFTLKDEIRSSIRKGKLVEYKCYDNQ